MPQALAVDPVLSLSSQAHFSNPPLPPNKYSSAPPHPPPKQRSLKYNPRQVYPARAAIDGYPHAVLHTSPSPTAARAPVQKEPLQAHQQRRQRPGHPLRRLCLPRLPLPGVQDAHHLVPACRPFEAAFCQVTAGRTRGINRLVGGPCAGRPTGSMVSVSWFLVPLLSG